jgi:thioesterase domain-containing protein/acyl carrier protein
MTQLAIDTAPTSCQKEEGSTALWRSVRSVVNSQRQAPPLQSVPRTGPLPLSFSQERIMLLHQLEPDSSTYNKSIIQRLKGPLNVAALEQSFNELIRRHEVLRTTFTMVDGQAFQRITPAQTLRLSVTDLQQIPEPERESEARRLAREETEQPFDLTQGPLLRTRLLRLGTEDYVMLLTTHQICFDGQSRGILIQELKALYEAFSTGKTSPLPELPVQYADFAQWQRQWFKGEVLETQLAYWKKQLGSDVPRLRLSTNQQLPGTQSFQAASQTLEIPTHLYESLRALSQQEGVTLFVTLLAAFQTLLYRYTIQEDILIFSSTGGRNRSEIKGLIGLFANILALRTDLSGNPPFRKLLSRVREVALGAYTHQDLPFDKLVEMLHSVPGQHNAPLFQVLFVLQNASMPKLEFSNLKVESFQFDNNGTTTFDLILYLEETAQGLTAWLRYKTDLFEAATITRMRTHFQTLLEGIVADPEQRISELPCLTETERQQLPVFGDRNQFASESDTASLEKTYQAPKNALELQLTKIWEKVLRVQPIGVHDHFFDIGGHSLLAVTLLSEVEKKFGKNIPWTTLFQAPTIEQLAHLMSQEESIRDSSLVIIQAGDKKRPPLFFIQVLGKGLGLCRPLARHLGADQPIYGLSTGIMDRKQAQLIKGGKEGRNHYLKEMRTIQPEGPYFLAGIYCGGRTAFEVAQLLHKQGQKIALLALLDTRVVLPPSASKTTITLRKRLYAHWNQFLQNGFQSLLKKGKKRLIWLIRMLQNKSMKIGCKFYDRLGHPLPPTLQDFAIEEAARTTFTYLPQKYPGQVTFFRAIDTSVFDDPIIGWHNVAEEGLEVHDIPGDTSSMLQEPHVQVLAKELKACIDKNNVVLPNE